jgi:hypothetical protein
MPSMSAARNESLVMLLANLRTRIRQYKSRISKWNLDKNIKPKEMKAIVRKRLERKLLEPNRPEFSFRVRNVEVEAAKIDRWMHSYAVPESTLYAPSSAACKIIPGNDIKPQIDLLQRPHPQLTAVLSLNWALRQFVALHHHLLLESIHVRTRHTITQGL